MAWLKASLTIASLVFPAALGAQAGGASIPRATIRVAFWGALAMAVTAGIGALIGRAVGCAGLASRSRRGAA